MGIVGCGGMGKGSHITSFKKLNGKICEQDGHLAHYETEHFIDCIINNKEPLTNARDALQGLRVIWKLYEAEEQNEIADLRGLGLINS